MNTFIKLPFYARVSLVLIGMYVFICILSKMQSIILPALYAIMIATSISPIVNFMVRKKINRTIAIMSVLAVSLLIAGMFIMLLSSQASLLSEAWPRLAAKFQTLLDQSVAWASGYFNISADKIDGWLLHEKTALMSNSNAAIGVTLTTMSGVLTAVLVIPVYIFMILFYQPHLVEFIHKVFGAGNDHKVSEILAETKSIIQSYLSGLFAEFVIVAILNSIGLLLLGIDYAILLGVVGALLNIIPYIGGIIGVLLFMVIALVTKTPVYVFYVVMMYTAIQLIDNNFIFPKIVGSKVKLNALISLLAVILGDALWGIPGMFLSIPIIAVLKLIFDRIESMKPWGFLLGDATHPFAQLKINLKGLAKKIPKIINPLALRQKV